MAKRRTIKEPETKGRVTVKEARATASKYRSAVSGRYVTPSHRTKKHKRQIIPRYEERVFINCPFDDAYRPMFDALVFAVYDCGFIARCTKEISDATSARIENILSLIGECKYGIHDISRTEPSAGSGLPRFNMPLELGLFLGAARFGRREKRCLVLDREQYRYQLYISDIAGQDIEPHGDNPHMAIRRVRDWLSAVATPPGIMLPGGGGMAARYEGFKEQLPTHCARNHLTPEELTFSDFSALVAGWLQANPW